MSERRKDTPREKKTASRSSRSSKSTEAQHQAKPEAPKAASRPHVYSTGIMPGQFSGARPESFRPPRPTQIPPNPPAHFPSDLWPEASVILFEARKQFPNQKYMLDLCKHIISELTPLYCGAVKAGKMEAATVLREGFGGMLDILWSLLVCNGDDPHRELGWGRNEAAEVYQGARNSEEWGRLAKAIANLEETVAPQAPKRPAKVGVAISPADLLARHTTPEVPAKTGNTIGKVGRPPSPDAEYERAVELERNSDGNGRRYRRH